MKGKVVATSSSSKRLLERAPLALDGQKLMKVRVNPNNGRTVFEFDLGGRVEAVPYEGDDKDWDLWYLFEWSGRVLTVRADGKYNYQDGDTRPALQKWHDL
jgi:hypothetical protein